MDPQITLHLHLLVPEIIVLATGLGVTLAEVMLPTKRRGRPAAVIAVAGLGLALLYLLHDQPMGVALSVVGKDTGAFAGQLLTGWRADHFALFTRGLALVGAILVVMLSIPYTRRLDTGHGEFYALLLFAVLGVMLVSGVSDLLSLFICLEMVTIPSYVLAAFKRNDLGATEAGLKYLVIGALSSAVLLFGIALTYGAVGEVAFKSIAVAVTAGAPSLLLVVGLVLIAIGIFFKVGGVPFHVWIPDVYEGAPSPVTAFLSTGSKAAGMILLLRFAQAAILPARGTELQPFWVWVIGGVSLATLLFGIFSAIPQRRIKRLFGYSSIGHAGYLLMGVAALAASGGAEAGANGASAILFYLLAFFFTNLTAFTVIVLVSGASGGRHDAVNYRGLWKRSPFLALAMTLALLSLAGVPPLSGFFGKFLVLSSVLESGLVVLAVVGALGVAVSMYFYLLWIREILVHDPDPVNEDVLVRVGPWARTVLIIGIVAIVGMGLFMGPFYAWAERAAADVIASL
jgi:NADH-quinone oxidoreductase subunit N